MMEIKPKEYRCPNPKDCDCDFCRHSRKHQLIVADIPEEGTYSCKGGVVDCELECPACREVPTIALSGYSEWFWLMCMNLKNVENRKWPLFRFIKPALLPIRVFIHASKTKASREEIEFIRDTLARHFPERLAEFDAVEWGKHRGCIIGELTITGQIELGKPYQVGDYSPWFFGKYGFLVQDGVLYDKPIPYKGQLGFFEVKL